MARIYFALWPPGQVSDALYKLAGQMQRICGGRIMRNSSLHCTLLFLGKVQRQRLPDLLPAIAQVHGASFRLCLEKFCCWQHNRIGCIAPLEPPTELEKLAAGLRRQVAAANFCFDQRTFSPHVTLLRNIARAVDRPVSPPLEWQVREFVLVESLSTGTGPSYRTLAQWSLE